MFNRMLTKTQWDSLYCCGESTAMGTGTPTVTISGLSAANAILKKLGLEEFSYHENMKNYVTIVHKPFEFEDQYGGYPEEERTIMNKASRCQYCEYPKCMENTALDIRGIMRRVTVGNFVGARKHAEGYFETDKALELEMCQSVCIQKEKTGSPVEIIGIIEYLKRLCQ